MEFEDLSEKMKREVRRVAAAFEVDSNGCSVKTHDGLITCFGRLVHHVSGRWIFELEREELVAIELGHDGCRVFLSRDSNEWVCYTWSGFYNEHMVKGLYRLGFEDESILTQLPPLSAHEQLELRLSMPRKFWPKTWLEEEAEV
jgi:hypothetical protein